MLIVCDHFIPCRKSQILESWKLAGMQMLHLYLLFREWILICTLEQISSHLQYLGWICSLGFAPHCSNSCVISVIPWCHCLPWACLPLGACRLCSYIAYVLTSHLVSIGFPSACLLTACLFGSHQCLQTLCLSFSVGQRFLFSYGSINTWDK